MVEVFFTQGVAEGGVELLLEGGVVGLEEVELVSGPFEGGGCVFVFLLALLLFLLMSNPVVADNPPSA